MTTTVAVLYEEPVFEPYPKVARLRRSCVITEKLDGTNAQILITEDGRLLAGSRSRWVTPEADNFGFARWCVDNHDELMKLGPGRHYGEWWGAGIQRRYGLPVKRFSLFNVLRWTATDAVLPNCVFTVPLLYHGLFEPAAVEAALDGLRQLGSAAAPGFTRPEGVVVYHQASGQSFKVTLEKDERPKGSQEIP